MIPYPVEAGQNKAEMMIKSKKEQQVELCAKKSTKRRRNLQTDATHEMDLLVDEIRTVMEAARTGVARVINTTMIVTYWQVGRIIIEHEQNGNLKAQYGKKLLPELSKRLKKSLAEVILCLTCTICASCTFSTQFSRRRLEN